LDIYYYAVLSANVNPDKHLQKVPGMPTQAGAAVQPA